MSDPKPINIAVLIHGMTPDPHPSDPKGEFKTFWNDIASKNEMLGREFKSNHVIFVTWGHEPENHTGEVPQDQRLTRAQLRISEHVQYRNVKANPGPNNIVMSGMFGKDWGIPGLRGTLMTMRETVVTFGLADVVYYCSEEGEKEVRNVVYGQVLQQLDHFKDSDASEIRLHVIGHSLGVVISHDFLYGLFKEGHTPGYTAEKQGTDKDRERFLYWRDRAQKGTLTLGSFTSMASQLPLFAMRKHEMINIFFNGHQLNLEDIGIVDRPKQSGVKWQIFYDIDDVLGFASRDLYYDSHNLVRQVQVNTGFDAKAHTDYVKNATVIEMTAELLARNCS